MSNNLYFYREYNYLGELSNFYTCDPPLIYNEKQYTSTEHIFQSLKYNYEGASDISIAFSEEIRTAKTPFMAKYLSWRIQKHQYNWQEKLNKIIKKYPDNLSMRKDWDDVKDEIMLNILRIKFQQNEHCRKVLCATNNKKLIENNPYDNYWSIGKGDGKNIMGVLLMKIRDEFIAD